jgi:oligosaccharide repeat unit polymerase
MKPYNIILWFYVVYALGVCAGYGLIEYPSISFFTLDVIFIYVSCLMMAAFVGYQSLERGVTWDFSINFDRLLVLIAVLGAVLVAWLWALNISHYGSLEYIILNSFTIRTNTIGVSESIFPVYLTYPSSLIYPAFVIALVLYEHRGGGRYLAAAFAIFVLIALQDLLTFGRIGILYAIFCVIGYWIVYRKRVFSLRNLLLFSALFFILMLPRLLRGSFDNMSETVRIYAPYLRFDIHPVFYSFLSVYIYYFSSPFALDSYLAGDIDLHTFGQRTFTPIYNLLSKFIGFERINTIDPMANVPFEYNIYTFVKDIYSDFSLVGVVLVPLAVGYVFGRVFRSNTMSANCLKIYMLGWLFYTPLFNAFSFGGFVIGFAFLIFLHMIGGANEGISNHS